MDVTLITKLAAAGSMGVSIYCIIKVYDLLKAEQSRDVPRTVFLRTIYISMGFAIVMTFLSLGIEWARYGMDAELRQLEKDLDDISNEQNLTIDQNGNPKDISLTYKKKAYTLSKGLSENHLEKSELKLSAATDNKYSVIKEGVNKSITFGYVSASNVKSLLGGLTTKSDVGVLKAEELYMLGLAYAPATTSKIISNVVQDDRFLSAEYLVSLLNTKDDKIDTEKENAIKLLTQPELMNILKKDQYNVLITALESGIRETPWDKYELAQVYLSRSGQTWNKSNAEADRKSHIQNLKDFKDYYEKYDWIRNTAKYPVALTWYNECKQRLENN